MKEILLEFGICMIVAAFLMVIHELAKAMVYMSFQKKEKVYRHSIWEIQRYLDPIGIILSVTSSVAFSKPFMFRIRDKKTNRVVGFAGFGVLILIFAGSILLLKSHVFGVQGMTTLEGQGIVSKVITLFLQYLSLLSLGMIITNLFPVSTFDMGLLIAGISSEKYLNIIKCDAVIKMIYIVCLIFELIPYGAYRLIQLLL